jgi:ATP-binding cassette, subfamily F, member 3
MIILNNLRLAYGQQLIFDTISQTIQHNDRIGLVGRNGQGKSTLLKALAGLESIDSGTITIAQEKRIAYLPQEVTLMSTQSVLEEVVSAISNIYELEQETKKLEIIIHDTTATPTQEILDRYAHLMTILAEHNPARLAAEARSLLHGLGFSQHQMEQPVNELSVGWKMRVVLAQLLIQKADFYLFDEPTNHLDIKTKEWFVRFLKKASFGFLLVSHERYFLDQLCTTILELETGKATSYNGNYSTYEVQKERNFERLEQAYLLQQKQIKQQLETAERFRSKATKATMAQAIFKRVEKIERITLPPSPKNITFSFNTIKRSGKQVLQVHNAGHKFDTKQLFTNVSFTIERGEKVALVAANGVGKTTLFNLITGKLPMQQGSVSLGYEVSTTLFAQEQATALNLEKTVIENVFSQVSCKSEIAIRTMLGSFLFDSDDINKRAAWLSGGEKNRVGMVNVLLQDSNFLLLDEPTNHLDIPSKDIVLKALQAYTGTILFVSHDHDFVNKLANRIIELTPHGIHSYHGTYESYCYQLEQKQFTQQTNTNTPTQAPTSSNTQKIIDPQEQRARNKECSKLERTITNLERDINKIEHSFAELAYGTPAFAQAQKKLNELQEQLTNAMNAWEKLIT